MCPVDKEEKKMKQGILYIVTGLITTLINTLLFMLGLCWVPVVLANAAAWTGAVVFAYGANARFVFCQPVHLSAFIRFVRLRLVSLGAETLLLEGLLQMNISPLVSKAAAAVFVVLANYILCRTRIFRKEEIHEIIDDHRSVLQ